LEVADALFRVRVQEVDEELAQEGVFGNAVEAEVHVLDLLQFLVFMLFIVGRVAYQQLVEEGTDAIEVCGEVVVLVLEYFRGHVLR
jgi:hypothetical protein